MHLRSKHTSIPSNKGSGGGGGGKGGLGGWCWHSRVGTLVLKCFALSVLHPYSNDD
jgi:hypothetical protein